jgi:hypothetical protein
MKIPPPKKKSVQILERYVKYFYLVLSDPSPLNEPSPPYSSNKTKGGGEPLSLVDHGTGGGATKRLDIRANRQGTIKKRDAYRT